METIKWTGKFIPYCEYRNKIDEIQAARLERAAENLRTYINLDYIPSDTQLYIVNIDGYNSVVCSTSRHTFPVNKDVDYIDFFVLVSPFDETRVYPIQRAELKLQFKLY